MFIPDTHEMFDLYDTLEELISKESHDIGLGLGSRVDADPDLEYLLEVLFTPVEARCSYLDIWGTKKYPDIITDIKDGKFMDMSMEEFEEKRKKWVKEIRETAHPMLRIVKAIKYGREVNDWEIKLHLQNLVSRQKNVLVYMQVCQNMITHGFSLDSERLHLISGRRNFARYSQNIKHLYLRQEARIITVRASFLPKQIVFFP